MQRSDSALAREIFFPLDAAKREEPCVVTYADGHFTREVEVHPVFQNARAEVAKVLVLAPAADIFDVDDFFSDELHDQYGDETPYGKMTIDELAAALDRLKILGAELLDRPTEKLLRYELNRQRRRRNHALIDVDGYDALLVDYVGDLRSARHPIETELQAWVSKIGADKVSDFLREFRRLQEWYRDEVTTRWKQWQHRQAVSRYKTMRRQIPAEYFDDSLDVQWNESEKKFSVKFKETNWDYRLVQGLNRHKAAREKCWSQYHDADKRATLIVEFFQGIKRLTFSPF